MSCDSLKHKYKDDESTDNNVNWICHFDVEMKKNAGTGSHFELNQNDGEELVHEAVCGQLTELRII